MCKNSVTQRNLKRLKLIEQYKEKREKLSKMIVEEKDLQKKVILIQKLDNLPKDSSKVKHRNRCNLTGRPRGFVGKFGICRNKMYELLTYIPGIRKASW